MASLLVGTRRSFQEAWPGGHLDLVIDGFARRDVGAADGADEGHVKNGDGLVGADAAADQGVVHVANGVRGRGEDAGVVMAGFERIVPCPSAEYAR